MKQQIQQIGQYKTSFTTDINKQKETPTSSLITQLQIMSQIRICQQYIASCLPYYRNDTARNKMPAHQIQGVTAIRHVWNNELISL
jgi:hypothetical protein